MKGANGLKNGCEGYKGCKDWVQKCEGHKGWVQGLGVKGTKAEHKDWTHRLDAKGTKTCLGFCSHIRGFAALFCDRRDFANHWLFGG